MYFDLFIPFPEEPEPLSSGKSRNKGKSKAAAAPNTAEAAARPTSCWSGIEPEDREAFAERISLAGHLGYNMVGCTINREPEIHPKPSPFGALPFPQLDPRNQSVTGADVGDSGLAGPSRGQALVQVTRYHFRLDDSKSHPLTSGNTNVLRNYDILSCQPTSDKALQLACTDLANPGPNQLSIITLPLHERPYHFRLNRKQIKQAQRNGVMFELLYSAGLFPSPSTPPDAARRYRQNWLTNAREVIRVTGGKSIILSSGPGGSRGGMRGPADLVNLATTLGMPANVAKDCLSLNGKMVLLRAQARRTYKAVLSTPRMVDPPGAAEGKGEPEADSTAAAMAVGGKRAGGVTSEAPQPASKKLKAQR